MKHKFSSMGRVAIALVLALSLSLVMAVPVSATHTSDAAIAFQEGASEVVGQASILDVTVENTDTNDSINKVTIDFSAVGGFTVTGAGTDPTGWTGSGPIANVVTYIADAGYEIAPGVLLAVTFSPAVTNPATAGDKVVPVVTTSDAGSKAALAFSEPTGWIGYIADDVGVTGNSIAIVYQNTAPYSVLVVTVAVSTITVELTDDGTNPTSTAAEVAAAINAHTAAAALVDAAVATGKGAEVVPLLSANNTLAGGTAAVVDQSCDVTPETLTVIAAPFAVWVDDDGNDANSGSEASPVATIAQGISIAPAGGTVNVLPGTYTPAAPIVITQDGLTLRSTGGAEVTIIDGTDTTGGGHNLFGIMASGVTFEGFTVNNSPVNAIGINYGTTGVTVNHNIISGGTTGCGILLIYDGAVELIVDSATVSNNVITKGDTAGHWTGICLMESVKNSKITDNTITGLGEGIVFKGGDTARHTENNIFTGNTITGCSAKGINLQVGIASGAFLTDNLIEGNTISENEDSGIEIDVGLTITDLTITGNDITSNVDDGVLIVSWGATNVISYNNIYDNAGKAIYADGLVVNAENNWWGTTVVATIAAMMTGTVDFTPWLTAPYAEPVTTISLESGWNLISLMLLPTDPDIDIVLAGVSTDVTVNKVTYFTGGPTGGWLSWFPSAPSNLTEMNHGKGYWIDVSAAGELTVTGVELALPGYAPPTYDVVVGWNLIGFTSTTAKTVDVYLGSVLATVEAMYGYNAATGLYEAVLAGNNLASGQGYWLAVNTAGKIYP